MNVEQLLDTVEQDLLSRQLSSLERFILFQSLLGRGYSEMAPDCAYSIAHIKEIGSQLWQALSKALEEKVTKKNLFLVLKQYLLSRTGETVVSDQLSVTIKLVEAIDPPLTPTTNQLPVVTDLVEASYSNDSEQLPLVSDRCELVTQEDEWLFRVQPEYQTSTDNTEVEDTAVPAVMRYIYLPQLPQLPQLASVPHKSATRCNKDAPVTQSEATIPGDFLLLDSRLYINRPPMEELTYTEISQPGCLIRIKAPRLRGKSSLLSRILNPATGRRCKTVYLDFQEADVAVVAELSQILGWLCANISRQLNLNPMLNEYWEYG